MAVRAIRGATQVDRDHKDDILNATTALVNDVVKSNGITQTDIISITFTSTPDLTAVAPALAARQLGITDAALMCVQEMVVAGDMPRVIRLMAHVDSARAQNEMCHIFHGATMNLRPDLAQQRDFADV